MKRYLQIYKFLFKTTPKVNIGLLIMMVSTIIYKIFYLEHSSLYASDNTSIVNIVFKLIFALFMLGSFGGFIGLMRETIKMPIFQMIPKIRNKVLVFGFLNILLLYLIGVTILGFSDTSILLYFTMLNLWFLSFSMTIIFFDLISVYQSNKYWLLKLLFLIFSIAGPIISYKDPMKRPVLYCIIVGPFIIIVFYQIINFINNYINLNFKDDITKQGLGKKANSLQNLLENLTMGNYSSTVNQVKKVELNRRYFKLFNITLFGPIGVYPWIAIGALTSMAYINFIQELNIKTIFVAVIGYFGFLAIINTSRYFKQKDKIGFLFINSGISRPQFELILLKVAVTRYLSRFLKAIPSIILVVLGNNLLFQPVTIYPLVICVTAILSMNIFVIYFYWNLIIKNKDYDTIKKARVMRT